MNLVTPTTRGLHCAAGDFYIDPWLPVERAVITHAHGDHARPGSGAYLCAKRGLPVLRTRLGEEARIEGIAYGETRDINGVKVSLHPAGHVLGSSQVRIESAGQVWVVSGDYKLDPDPTCEAFEPVRCHTFVTESTWDGLADKLTDKYGGIATRIVLYNAVGDPERFVQYGEADRQRAHAGHPALTSRVVNRRASKAVSSSWRAFSEAASFVTTSINSRERTSAPVRTAR